MLGTASCAYSTIDILDTGWVDILYEITYHIVCQYVVPITCSIPVSQIVAELIDRIRYIAYDMQYREHNI